MNISINSIKFSLVCIALLILSACNGGGGSSSSNNADNSAATANTRPIANAGADQVVSEGQLVTLLGNASYDPEGDSIVFQWRQLSGTAITLSSESDDTPSFIAPNGSQTLTFQLVTDDGLNLSIADTVTITVTSSNGQNSGGDSETPNTGNDSGNTNSGGSTGNTDSPDDSPDDSSDGSSSDDNPTDGSGDTNTDDSTGNPDSGTETNAEENDSDNTDNENETDPVLENTAPTANAGQDNAYDGFSLVILDGSLSSDPENDTLTYNWQQLSGSPITLNNSNIVAPNFDAPNINDTLIFSLTVSDAEYSSEVDEVSITLQQINTPPNANAGADINVSGLSSASLQGSQSSDPEGDSLSFEWQQLSGTAVSLSDTQIANPSFEAPNETGTLTFSLTVSDAEFSATDTVSVNIQAINTAPTANAGNDQTAEGLTEIFLDGSLSSDPEGNDLTYTWEQLSGTSVSLANSDTTNPSFIAPNANDTLSFSLVVNDGELDSQTDIVLITIQKINTVPVAHAGVDRYVGSLSVVALNGTMSDDADGDPITYSWTQVSGPSVVLSDIHAPKPIFTADTDGQLSFSLTVNDGQNDSEADTVKVVVGPIPATNIKVNGTGITWGGNYPTGNNPSCTGEAIDQQDCSLGREITHNDDSDGRVGFSLAKFDENGVDVGNDANEWQCVQDSITGLMWEVKSGGNGIIADEGINDADDRFSWYNTDPATNGGGPGHQDFQGAVCSDYDAEDPQTHCNTQAFVARMNKRAWCGFADWRLPNRKELLSIVDYGNSRPMIDADYFPTVGQFIWTSSPLAIGSASAWGVNFHYGNSFSIDKRNARQVRLVRGGYE